MNILKIVLLIFEKFPGYTSLILDMIASGEDVFKRFHKLFGKHSPNPTSDEIKAKWESWDSGDPIP